MITYEQALAKAHNTRPDTVLDQAYDLDDVWAFMFAPDTGEELTGEPFITVNKETGELGDLTIPPLENLFRLQKGKKIK